LFCTRMFLHLHVTRVRGKMAPVKEKVLYKYKYYRHTKMQAGINTTTFSVQIRTFEVQTKIFACKTITFYTTPTNVWWAKQKVLIDKFDFPNGNKSVLSLLTCAYRMDLILEFLRNSCNTKLQICLICYPL
jgi:hypothetical protein